MLTTPRYAFRFLTNSSNLHIQSAHDELVRWSSQMDLKINETKCKSLTIRKCHNCVDIVLDGVVAVDTLNILGVTFDGRCGWTSHVQNVIKNTSKRFYALRLLRPTLRKEQLLLVYNSLLRSVLEYCNPLLLGMSITDSCRLERVQKRFHRLLCGPSCREECMESLSDRRRKASLRFLDEIKDTNHILHHLLPPISSTGRFLLPS